MVCSHFQSIPDKSWPCCSNSPTFIICCPFHFSLPFFNLQLNPQFIKIHAAFSRVLYLSGAADYFDKVEDTAEQNSFPMRANQTWGYFSLIGLRMSNMSVGSMATLDTCR